MRRALLALVLSAGLAALGVAGLAALRHNAQPPPDDFGPVGDFSLTERGGRTVTNADLGGMVWVASFVFTRCTGPCPQVTGTVARIQDAFRGEEAFYLVTFTVDPERDDPEELKKYADHFGADPKHWLFLTGPEDKIDRLLKEQFHVGVQRDKTEVTHSTKLALVDKHGHIRGYFDGRQVDEEGQPIDELPKLRKAVAALLREAR